MGPQWRPIPKFMGNVARVQEVVLPEHYGLSSTRRQIPSFPVVETTAVIPKQLLR